jgi:hypothetical protein
MVEKNRQKLKAKGKGGTAQSKAKRNPKRKASGGPTGRVSKKGHSEKFCQHCKAHGGPFQTHNILDCRCYDSNGKPLAAVAGKPSESKKPYKKSGEDKGMAFMQSTKSQKKAGKSKKRKKRNYDPVTVPTVNKKLGTATRDLVYIRSSPMSLTALEFSCFNLLGHVRDR